MKQHPWFRCSSDSNPDYSAMAEKTPSKKSLFQALEQLDELDDPQDDQDTLLERLTTGARHKEKPASRVSESPQSRILPRANSDPQSSSLSKEDRRAILPCEETPRKAELTKPNVMPVKRSLTTGAMPGNKSSGSAPKKRRMNSIRTIPAEQQIFKELVFFFFPNNDVSPPRRLRIQRAQEYGAQWAREWGEQVTHIIVDKGLRLQDLLTNLKLESLPANVVLVDESYPSDCIKFRSVISPLHARFRVDGAPADIENDKPPPADQPFSPQSLPLKPSKKERLQSPEPSQPHVSDKSSPVVHPPLELVTSDPVHEADAIPVSRERDALDDIIDEAKAARHLLLDPLDTPDYTEAETSGEENSAWPEPESSRNKGKSASREVAKSEKWMQSFACMQNFGPNSRHDNLNGRTIEVLQQMLDYYTRTADHWRVLAYRKAINALRRQPRRIVTRSQAISIRGIGPRLADKIEEIVLTNHLRRLDNTNDSAEDRIIQEFLGVYGAGLAQASKWVAQGYRSLSDLQIKAALTKNQRVGVEHYYDFAQRISRAEVAAHGEVVRQAVHKVDADMQVIIGGSYRRGALDSGDIDVLITKPSASLEQIRSTMIDIVIPQLFASGFLQMSLAATSRQDGSKWHGASTLPGSKLWRRFVPGPEIGAALIYFTGNDIFNRSMRLLASKKGMCLNQRGLYTDVLRTRGRVKLNPGRLLEGHDERRIFDILGVPWRPPEHRIC